MKLPLWSVLSLAVMLPAAIADEPLTTLNSNAQTQAAGQSNLSKTSPLQCLRCHHDMEIGTLLDRNYLAIHTAMWMRGVLDEAQTNKNKYWRDKTCKSTTAFCCPNCGYVEIYATSTALSH